MIQPVLVRHDKFTLDLDNLNSDDLKRAARFWIGVTASNKLRKTECAQALSEVFRDRIRLEAGLRSLSEDERELLGVYKFYGGSLSGPLVICEALSRKLIPAASELHPYHGGPKGQDTIADLAHKLLLVHNQLRYYSGYSSYGYRRFYPTYVLPGAVAELVEATPPLPWQASAAAPQPTFTSQRSAAEIVLDLWTLAQTLAQVGVWKTIRGGAPAKSTHNRLSKLFPEGGQDELLPPNPETLYYELLRGTNAIRIDGDQGRIDLSEMERQVRQPESVQAWNWIRAWMKAPLWQDGIGAVPDWHRSESERIEPVAMQTARELLVWALCRVARTSNAWMDLETFLVDLWSETGEETIDFYHSEFSWQPDIDTSRGQSKLTAEALRRRTYWLTKEGRWVANALMATLVYLGLVERGSAGANPAQRPCFRLTGLGRAVFAAPQEVAEEPRRDVRFLIVQPNHELLANLDAADAGVVWPLARLARRTSTAPGRVQTFELTRASIYQALESGMTLEQIRTFLTTHSKTGLPDNVAQSLTEWGRRREALVLRTEVNFLTRPQGEGNLLLNRTTLREYRGYPVVDHVAEPRPTWRLEEDGRVHGTDESDSLALLRLRQFAESGPQGWRITSASVRRARERGITADQILAWLGVHLSEPLPPIMETAIRNWASTSGAFLDNLLLLQVKQPQACAAILSSQRFRPLLLGQVPPNWFVVRPEKRTELEQLLAELGFAFGAPPQLAAVTDAITPEAQSPEEDGTKGRRGRRKSK